MIALTLAKMQLDNLFSKRKVAEYAKVAEEIIATVFSLNIY